MLQYVLFMMHLNIKYPSAAMPVFSSPEAIESMCVREPDHLSLEAWTVHDFYRQEAMAHFMEKREPC